MLGEPARQIRVTDDRDAFAHNHLTRNRQFAVAALFGRQIHDDAARAHGTHHLSADQLGRRFAWDQGGGDDDVDVLGLLGEDGALSLLEAFAHDFGVAADAAAFFLIIDAHELGTHGFDLVGNLRPCVVGAHNRTQADSCTEGS